MMMFPTINSKNLHNEAFTLPGDFWGQYNVVLLKFYDEQQPMLDTWSDFLIQLREDHPIIDVYELPVARRYPWFQRAMMDYWKRATTIPVHTDIPTFISALNLTDTSDIYIMLVDRDGKIHWRDQGIFTLEKGRKLAFQLRLLPVRVW